MRTAQGRDARLRHAKMLDLARLHQLLIGEGAIDFGGIKKCDAAIKSGADHGDTVLIAERGSVAEIQAHAAVAEGGYFKAVFAEFSFLHCSILSLSAAC